MKKNIVTSAPLSFCIAVILCTLLLGGGFCWAYSVLKAPQIATIESERDATKTNIAQEISALDKLPQELSALKDEMVELKTVNASLKKLRAGTPPPDATSSAPHAVAR